MTHERVQDNIKNFNSKIGHAGGKDPKASLAWLLQQNQSEYVQMRKQ